MKRHKYSRPNLHSNELIRKKGSSREMLKETVESIKTLYAELSKEDSWKFESFKQFPLSPSTQQGLEENGYVTPTDIQRESLRYSLTGADVVGAAKTGCGKTLALLIPVLECLWRQNWSRRIDGLGALIISPTRELSFQTFKVLNRIGAYHQFSAALLIGGTDVDFERKRIGMVNIIVCTPGRLLQHMDENSTFSCEQLQILIIDEADRILDLGFSKQMNAILENLPKDRQTLLFSATQTKNVNDLVRLALKDPVYVSVHENAPQATPEFLSQSYIVCDDENKINTLWSFLSNHRKKKILIFVLCCKQARFLTEMFCHLRPGLSLMGLWGTMNQMKRLEVFNKFNSKKTGCAMIATDVASRGLDFARVDWVLQLDCPAGVDDYIHRVGRTARMDATGKSMLILTPTQEQAMVARLQARNVPITRTSVNNNQIVDISKRLQSAIAQYPNMKEFAQRSFVAYIRAIYLMHDKDIFDVNMINFTALAKSYGLVSTPRVRFLRRIAHKHNRMLQVCVNQKVDDEKSAEELMEMMISTAERKGAAFKDNMRNGSGRKDTAAKSGSGITNNVKEETLGVVSEVVTAENTGLKNGNDLLEITRKDIFNVLSNEAIELEEPVRKMKKYVTKYALAKKMLRKGIKLNVKKVYADEETKEGQLVDTTENNGESPIFSVDEAKREMRQVDQIDKAIYKEKQKKWKKKKKEKQKENMRKKIQYGEGGVVLDFGSVENTLNRDGTDLSWLPDPDKPKKYDVNWNEIDGNSVGDSNKEINITEEDHFKRSISALRRKRKLLREEKLALALLCS